MEPAAAEAEPAHDGSRGGLPTPPPQGQGRSLVILYRVSDRWANPDTNPSPNRQHAAAPAASEPAPNPNSDP